MGRRWIQAAVVILIVASAVIIVREQSKQSEEAAWTALDEARLSESPAEALEAAREAARGTSAEPLATFHLAMQLYADGTRADLTRAREVARLALQDFPDHPVAERLQTLLSALDGYLASG